MQDVIPKTPANAVATVMITLRTMPHTDFDFVLMLFGFNVKTSVQGIILTDFPPRRRRRRVCFFTAGFAAVHIVFVSLFQLAFQINLGVAQFARGACTELQALYIVRQRKVGSRGGVPFLLTMPTEKWRGRPALRSCRPG